MFIMTMSMFLICFCLCDASTKPSQAEHTAVPKPGQAKNRAAARNQTSPAYVYNQQIHVYRCIPMRAYMQARCLRHLYSIYLRKMYTTKSNMAASRKPEVPVRTVLQVSKAKRTYLDLHLYPNCIQNGVLFRGISSFYVQRYHLSPNNSQKYGISGRMPG